ncbi:hypothetical protein H5200_09045 [Pseudoalteromonas sp. SG43-7]|uniref:hypothetical protein n=1 Tax=Pseudoalteromonas sp. SG43-7 TaxID=2760966 RepID=UPI00160465F9|nr:hypothetical protein [Pseudoalteromonas sp. SG43-7]MBB1422062.1 hypothetical protein [Pseudoalteromonas sp. SG43-7]
MSFLKKIIILSLLMLLGCQTLNTIPIEVNISQEVTFSGKGAGAGIALMSAMGPSGLAIGLAIDVGIAKEIKKNITHQQLESSIKSILSKYNSVQLQNDHIHYFEITTLKFQSFSDDSDPTAVIIEGNILFKDERLLPFSNISYYEKYITPLMLLKSKKSESNALILENIEHLISTI